MADWIDDLRIAMTPIRRGRARVLPGRWVEPSTPPLTPPPVVEMSRAPDPPHAESGSTGPQTIPPATLRDHAVDVRTLIVGREVALSGEISSCDRFIVEGAVHANIVDCENLTIAETGEFEGNASSQNVDVRGRFDGDLVVRQRLLIRAAGRVSGKIAYKEIDIERGGQISGEIHLLGGNIPDRTTRHRRGTPN
jgi:cytoskeletal protein CcmA (bactofilin family)